MRHQFTVILLIGICTIIPTLFGCNGADEGMDAGPTTDAAPTMQDAGTPTSQDSGTDSGTCVEEGMECSSSMRCCAALLCTGSGSSGGGMMAPRCEPEP